MAPDRDAADAMAAQKRRRYDMAGFTLWVVLTAALTLTPTSAATGHIERLCLLCGELGGADLVRNILLFAPAGLFFGRRGLSVIVATGIGLLLSSGIELSQLLLIPGRHASARDVLMNGVGAGFGALFHSVMSFGIRTRSRALLSTAAAFAVAGVVVTGWLMQPVSTDQAYYAHWEPKRRYYAPWDGELLAAMVDSLTTPIGLLSNTNAARSALEASRPVSLMFTRGTPTPSLTAFYAITDEWRREILMIGADGDDLVIRPRLRSQDFFLDISDQRFAGFLGGIDARDTINLAVTTNGHGVSCVRQGNDSTCAAAPSIGAGWQLILYKGSLPAGVKRGLHGFSIAVLLLPLMVLATGQPRSRAALLLVATFVAMAVVGRPFGLAWPGVPESIAVASAILIALAAGRQGSQRN